MKGNNKALFSSLFIILLLLLTNNNVFAHWRPTGSIQVFDDVLNRNVPVVAVNVRVRKLVKWWQGYTDNNGNFSSSKEYRTGVYYSLRWQYKDNKFDIRTGAIGQAKYNGPNNKKSAWNLTITSGMQWVYAHIYRAGSYYIKQEPFGLSNNPFSRISFCVYNRNAPSTETGHYNNFNENIIMYKNNSSGNSYTARELFSIASHELAHAHHDEIYTGGSVYIKTTLRLKESWATAVSYFLTSRVYSLPLNSPDYYRYTKQDFKRSSTSEYTPLMIDLIDDFNQGILDSTFLDDPVKGYNLKQMETILRKAECRTLQDFINEIKALPLPAGVSANDRDTYLNQFAGGEIYEIRVVEDSRFSLSTAYWFIGAGIWTVRPEVWGNTFTYSGSIQHARGNYIFDQTISSLFLFNGLSFSSERLNFSMSIPVTLQSTPCLSYSGVGILPSGCLEHTPEPVDYEQFGIGDPTVSLGLRLVKESKLLPTVQLVIQAKLPLASIEKGFGTGEWDYSGGLSLSKVLGKTFLFVDMYYWTLGDLPDLELKDTVSYSIALGQPLFGKYALFVSYSGSTNIISEVAPPSFLTFGFSYRIDTKKSLMLNASLGLTESVPDFSVSLGWNIGF